MILENDIINSLLPRMWRSTQHPYTVYWNTAVDRPVYFPARRGAGELFYRSTFDIRPSCSSYLPRTCCCTRVIEYQLNMSIQSPYIIQHVHHHSSSFQLKRTHYCDEASVLLWVKIRHCLFLCQHFLFALKCGQNADITIRDACWHNKKCWKFSNSQHRPSLCGIEIFLFLSQYS